MEECIKAKRTTMQNTAEQNTSWQNIASQNNAFLQASGEGSDKCLMAQHKAEHKRAGYCSTGDNNKQQNRTLQCNAEQHKAFIGALKARTVQNNA